MVRRFFRTLWRHKLRLLAVVAVAIPVFAWAGYEGTMKVFHDYPNLCATCHVIDPYYKTWVKSDFLDHRHTMEGTTVKVSSVEGWGKKDVVCKDCHYSTPLRITEELVNYIKGDYVVPLEERRLRTTECFGCHGDYAKLIELTEHLEKKYPRLATVRNMTPESDWNPHRSHFGEVECRVCHRMHRPSVDFCSTCHGPTMSTEPGWTSKVEWRQEQ